MHFVDTHTHMYDEQFGGESADAVLRAIQAGVSKMIFPDIDRASRNRMFALAAEFPGKVFPCLGLHPTSIGPGWEQEMDAFERQIRLACSLGLPVIIHSRDATDLIFKVLDRCRALSPRGAFHAFSGSRETFERLSGYGDWYVGIGGVITYKKASIAETIRHIPLDRILLETDSPYLTPAPHRGERNESGYIPFIAAKIAEQKDISVEEVARVTTENAERLFNI